MSPFAWILGLILPSVGAEGAQGLPVPPPMEHAAIVRPRTPNTALAAPEGFTPAPDVVVAPIAAPPKRVYDALRAVAAEQPRVYLAAEYADRLQVHYVARTPTMNWPDLIMAEVSGPPEGPSSIVLWSRSIYGYGDRGLNKVRVEAWLASLPAALAK